MVRAPLPLLCLRCLLWRFILHVRRPLAYPSARLDPYREHHPAAEDRAAACEWRDGGGALGRACGLLGRAEHEGTYVLRRCRHDDRRGGRHVGRLGCTADLPGLKLGGLDLRGLFMMLRHFSLDVLFMDMICRYPHCKKDH